MQGHILVVEGSPAHRRFLSDSLREPGYAVTEAATATEALEALGALHARGEALTLIITDNALSDVDGCTLVRRLKEGPYRFVPVLLLGTSAGEEAMALGRASGAAAWLVKPFSPHSLLMTVRKLVWQG